MAEANRVTTRTSGTAPQQLRAYSDEDPLTHGVERAELLLGAIEKIFSGRILTGTLVDVGCGYGGLSLTWASGGRRAIAVDVEEQPLRVVCDRTRQQPLRGAVAPIRGDVLALPLKNEIADYVVLAGVIEWVGFGRWNEAVKQVQIKALREALRILKPTGLLIVGTKNRLFPRYLWCDPQLRLPAVNLLPRSLADAICRRVKGYGYRGYIYSYWGWRRLLREAGAGSGQIWIPLLTYQYPIGLGLPWAPISVRNVLARSRSLPQPVETAALQASSTRMRRLREVYYEIVGRLGLLGLGAGSFLIVAAAPVKKKTPGLPAQYGQNIEECADRHER